MFEQLVIAAKSAYAKAYAPYSKFRVGAAALTLDNSIIKGCNVENASYGLTVCAERNCIAQGVINGQQRFSELVVYTEEENLTPPCGACRQVIVEFMAQDANVYAVNHLGNVKQWSVSDLLPDAFTPDYLNK
ncbi:cytidine deaminase [Thalassotalea sp. LPB0316]|uniref:cytidine deaminase n=1 Tax=Thalassotalea sp. LPB0316 TaxID=2769490 RepID=UPI001868E2EE|nr:cytidine deaminase [Thalassotalea sp. LPB0316]QOL24929.1 cytidine deaminase [Thalassotalea sp. LPB0316]